MRALARAPRPAVALPDRTGARLTLLAWLPMLGWYAALRPGLMSADSLVVWGQASDGGWADLHPPVYTAAVWLSSTLVGDPGLVVLGQSLFLVAGLVALGRAVARLGAPTRLVALASAVVAVSPTFALFAMSVWKDVPYTAAVLFASARVVDLVGQRLGSGPVDAAPIARSLTAWLVAATLLRQNGLIFAVFLLVVLAVLLRGRRRSVAFAGGIVVVSLVLAKGLVYPALGVTPAPAQASLAMLLHDIAAVARTSPSTFEPEDRALLGRVAPFETWRESSARFGCASANWEWGPEFDWSGVDGHAGDYLRLWVEAVDEQPRRVTANRLCVGAIVWRPHAVDSVYTVSRGIDANRFGLETRPVVAGLDRAALRVLDATNGPNVQWLVWRGPTWIYASWIALGVAAARRRRPVLLLAAVPTLALQVSVFPFNPAQDARYMFAGVVLGVLLLPVAMLPGRRGPASPDRCVDGAEDAPPPRLQVSPAPAPDRRISAWADATHRGARGVGD